MAACSNHARPIMIINKVYTDFSFEKGCINSSEFCKIVSSDTKFIILDFYSISGISNYYEYFKKKNSPILGCEIFIRDFKHKYNIYGKVTILISSIKGYLNLKNILDISWMRYKKKNLLYNKISDFRNFDGLIFLSGGFEGIYSRFEKCSINFLKKYTLFLKKKFKNFVIELQNFDKICNRIFISLIKVSKLSKVDILFTHPVRFYKKSNYSIFVNKYCIIKKDYVSIAKKKLLLYKNNFYKNNKNIYNIDFKKIKYIKKKSISLNFEYNFICFFKKQKNLIKNSNNKLKKIIINKAKKKKIFKTIRYRYRVLKEFFTIKSMGFSSHFLIVFDIIRWSKKKKILVGPGRGSGASSLISYLIGITDVDPIKHNLIFERFLNKSKKSIPDFDIDFCNKDRDKILKYIRSKFGKKKALNIVTYSSFLFKNTIRDCTRIFGYGYSLSNKIIKDIEINNIKNISDALSNCNCKHTSKILNASIKLEGRIRGIGTHAGGVIIDSNSEIPFFMIDDNKNFFITQFNKKFLDFLGIIKLDILGLNTLSILSKIGKKINKPINYRNLNFKDYNTIKTICFGDTIGVFQLESWGIRKFIKKIKVKNFNDVINAISIYRPGPINFINKFIKKKIKRKNKEISKILKETNGFIIFQEQIINIAKYFARFSLDEADIFRNAISKNIDIKSYKKKFIDGCLRNNILLLEAKKIFLEITNLCGYSFNRAHAVSYSYITFYMAFLKTNYKLLFYKCSLDYSYKNKSKIKSLYEDCIDHSVFILKPDINKSNFNFKIENDCIRIGFCALKGFNKKSSIDILKERKKNGFFKNLFDFLSRIDKQVLRRNILEILLFCGAFDCLENNRELCYGEISYYIKNRNSINFLNKGQISIFNKIFVKYKKIKTLNFIKKENQIIGFNLSNIDIIFGDNINFYKKKYNHLFINYDYFFGLLLEIKSVKKGNNLILLIEKRICLKKYFIIDKDLFFKKKINVGSAVVIFYNFSKNMRYNFFYKTNDIIEIKDV